jgi:hypothetical protein
MPAEVASSVAYRRQTHSQSPDWAVAGLAGRQHGVVTRPQLLEAGLSRSGIDRRIRSGRLHVLHPRVYAMGHRVVSREGRWLAAVLSAGDRAVLSHRSAACLWGLLRTEDRLPIEISAPRATRSTEVIRRHRARLAADEVTTRRQIPVTTLRRTLLDLAAKSSLAATEAAVREAEYLHRLTLTDLGAIVGRYRGMRGVGKLRTCLDRLAGDPQGRSRSKLEARFAALIGQLDLPRPELNILLECDGGWVEADCLWRNQRLIVELDGARSHRTRSAFESDRERDRRLQAAGWRVVRVTWRQLNEPRLVVDDLRRLLEPA